MHEDALWPAVGTIIGLGSTKRRDGTWGWAGLIKVQSKLFLRYAHLSFPLKYWFWWLGIVGLMLCEFWASIKHLWKSIYLKGAVVTKWDVISESRTTLGRWSWLQREEAMRMRADGPHPNGSIPPAPTWRWVVGFKKLGRILEWGVVPWRRCRMWKGRESGIGRYRTM